MHTSKDNMTPDQDGRLADFTDRVLGGQTSETEASLGDELRDLEQTILQLHQAIPKGSLDPVAFKQMQVRLKTRIRKEQEQVRGFSSWKNWFTPTYMRSGLFLAVVMLVVATLVMPILGSSSSSTSATALNPSINLAIVFLLAGVIIFIFRMTRRK